MGRLFGGAGRYERAVADAQRRYGKALAERAEAERERLGRLEAAEQAYAQRRAAEQEAVDRHNAEVDRLKQRFDAGDADAVVECFRRVLRRSAYPDGFPRSYRVAYQAEARQLVIEYQLPGREIIPTQARFNYNESLDLVEAKPRAPKEIASCMSRSSARSRCGRCGRSSPFRLMAWSTRWSSMVTSRPRIRPPGNRAIRAS